MNFEDLYLSYLTEFTVADAGIAGTADFSYKDSDSYAPDDARTPKVLGATLTRKGKTKKKEKN